MADYSPDLFIIHLSQRCRPRHHIPCYYSYCHDIKRSDLLLRLTIVFCCNTYHRKQTSFHSQELHKLRRLLYIFGYWLGISHVLSIPAASFASTYVSEFHSTTSSPSSTILQRPSFYSDKHQPSYPRTALRPRRRSTPRPGEAFVRRWGGCPCPGYPTDSRHRRSYNRGPEGPRLHDGARHPAGYPL